MKIECDLNIEHFGKERLIKFKNDIDSILLEHDKKKEMEIVNYKTEISTLKGKVTSLEKKQGLQQRGRKRMFNIKRLVQKSGYNETVELNIPYTELQPGDKIV